MGEDDREVVPDSVAKSIGREHTFQNNIEDKEILKNALLLLARDVSLRAKQKGLYGRTVTLKIKVCDMHSITRSKSSDATNSTKDIYGFAVQMLDKLKLSEPIRLVGVTLGNLQDTKNKPYSQLSLFDEMEGSETARQKSDALEDAIFDLHTKYGRNILKTGKELEVQQKITETEENN
jgi:DNA polymerase-4